MHHYSNNILIKLPNPKDHKQSFGEEIANSISHGVGFLLALTAAPFLIISAARHGNPAGVVGACVFAVTTIILYFTSALYHGIGHNKAKRIFRVLDHCAIFLLIAGTYTPFTLGVIRGAWGWTMLGLVWSMAVLGIVFKSIRGVKYSKLSTFIYLAMGWLVIIAIKPLLLNMEFWGLFWLASGGGAYTLGVVFYAARKIPYGHLIWHLFVITGTACHFIAVLRYAA
ncbi:MAG: hemolysin III family protein [Candidatus Neomarinimicrobiota bacterium]